MRILLASSGSGSRGGGEIFLAYLGTELAAQGHEVVAWMPSHPRMDELAGRCATFARVARAEYANTYDRPGRSLSAAFSPRVVARVAGHWASLAPDVIHVNKQNLEDGLELLRAADRYGRPTVCTIHLTQTARYLGARLARLRDWISRRELASYPGTFVAVQPARAASLQSFLPRTARVETVYNGVPLPALPRPDAERLAIRRALGVEPHERVVLGVGRLVAQKRPLAFLETAAALHERVPGCRFFWVGDGEMRAAWESWISSRGLGAVIRCVGWQSPMQPYFHAADALLHVAEFEGLPLALVEALASATPCLVSRGFASEIPVLDGQSVAFADDLPACAALLADTQRLRELGLRGRRLAERHFSARAMATGYLDLYQGAR